jgi:sec-independent protein translocase protein TatA
MPNLGPTELIIIGLIVVLLFGASRLPATAKGLGQALRLFKKEIRDDKEESAEVEAAKTATQAPVQQVPVQQVPVQQAPVQQAPVQQAPVQPAPVQPVAADGSSAPSAVRPGNQD